MDDGFIAHVLDLIGDPAVSPRRMFGAVGLWRDGRMFAIVIDDELYLKADEVTQASFEDAGSEPFVYSRGDRNITIGKWWRTPDGALEDAESLRPWLRAALDAAMRAPAKTVKSARRKGALRRR